jgi:hypothetical protein
MLAAVASHPERPKRLEPCFDDVPHWVRTFYWVPVLGRFAKDWMQRHGAYRPAEPPSSADPGDDDAGVREPRRPRPSAGAGAVALEEPFEDEQDGLTGSFYGGFEGSASPTSAA